ncbi:MAG: hypothetical protein IPK16_31710 [Anaerolineales bacterium]|nr:hypothetical protein [Anaerolineales bacterium]
MPSVANEAAGSRPVEAAITDGASVFVRDNTLYLQDYANDQLISPDQCTTTRPHDPLSNLVTGR